MPFPEYSTGAQWITTAGLAARRHENADGIDRHGISSSTVQSIIEAEAAGADESGVSHLSAQDLAEATGTPLRTVLLVRAGLANSGLIAQISTHPPSVQLQLPRGATSHEEDSEPSTV